jgi:hypothetical protein
MSLNKIVRAVIINDSEVLLGREKGQAWYFLPGWRVDYGEKSEETLKNNIRQKLDSEIRDFRYIGAVGYDYVLDKFKTTQEFEIIYFVHLHKKFSYFEDGKVEYVWQSIKNIGENNILPKLLKSKITEWFDNQNVFWISSKNQ